MVWSPAASLAIREIEMARRYTQPAPNFQGGRLKTHDGPTSQPVKDRTFNPQPTTFFQPTEPKMAMNDFLSVVLQKIHPTLFQFWQRNLMQDLEQQGKPNKVWYA